MYIGNIQLKNNIFLAPMAGITDVPFRIICKQLGCGLTYTEMASSRAFEYLSNKTHLIAQLDPVEKPAVVQIFGSDAQIMANTAEKLCNQGVDIIDINMGCPTPKIVKNGEGAALMLNPETAYKIIEAVVNKSTVPVTVKMRKCWDIGLGADALEISKLAEKAGASAVAVHGRTREQFYSGKADWDIIKKVKELVSIPVIGNGDIFDPESAKQMLEYTNCDAIMIGRAAQGNPWIFKRIIHYLESDELLPEPSPKEKVEMAISHFKAMIQYKGEYVGIREMRKHIAWYMKGLENSARFRDEINKITEKDRVLETLHQYLLYLATINSQSN